MMKYTQILFVAAFLVTTRCQKLTQVVRTDKGDVQGRVYETVWHSMPYSAFLGVPYARPPVGNLRFKDPIEANSWRGVLKTIEEPPSCAHYLLIYPFGKEDCLYLNVYTPVLNFHNITRLRPVMFWIFGGGYQAGSANHFLYQPDFLLEQDVVYVAPNYRLGPLGFLALGHPDARGNQGLKDQNMALKWVQRNIAAFGGDPNRVTLFGESAGASSVGYHLTSPKSAGLFHKAILQSASPLSTWAYQSPEAARNRAYDLASRIGISARNDEELLRALKKADVRDIIKATAAMIGLILPFQIFMPFTPTTETIYPHDAFVNDCPITKLQTGDFHRVPMLMGYNKDEATVFGLGMTTVRTLLANQIYNVRGPDLQKFGKLFLNFVEPIANSTIANTIQGASLYYFSGPLEIAQRYYAKFNTNNPIYYYFMAHETEYNFHKILDPNVDGTSHGDELSLLFHMAIRSPTNPDLPYNVFRRRCVMLWTNFVKYGNPTPDKSTIGIRWLPAGNYGWQLNITYGHFNMVSRVMNKNGETFEKQYTDRLPTLQSCPRRVANPPSVFDSVTKDVKTMPRPVKLTNYFFK